MSLSFFFKSIGEQDFLVSFSNAARFSTFEQMSMVKRVQSPQSSCFGPAKVYVAWGTQPPTPTPRPTYRF